MSFGLNMAPSQEPSPQKLGKQNWSWNISIWWWVMQKLTPIGNMDLQRDPRVGKQQSWHLVRRLLARLNANCSASVARCFHRQMSWLWMGNFLVLELDMCLTVHWRILKLSYGYACNFGKSGFGITFFQKRSFATKLTRAKVAVDILDFVKQRSFTTWKIASKMDI